jgi:hypothetical protein
MIRAAVLVVVEVALAPVLFGSGRRLFENLREPGPQFRIDRVLDGLAATHLRFVRQREQADSRLQASRCTRCCTEPLACTQRCLGPPEIALPAMGRSQ